MRHALEGTRTRRMTIVAALENVRIQLLRIGAGIGTPDDMREEAPRCTRWSRAIACCHPLLDLTRAVACSAGEPAVAKDVVRRGAGAEAGMEWERCDIGQCGRPQGAAARRGTRFSIGGSVRRYEIDRAQIVVPSCVGSRATA